MHIYISDANKSLCGLVYSYRDDNTNGYVVDGLEDYLSWKQKDSSLSADLCDSCQLLILTLDDDT